MNSLPSLQLTEVEREEFERCEATIARSVDKLLEVGHSLMIIRDLRLYRETHGTFERYVKERWQLKRTLAYYYLDAAEVHGRLLCQNFDIHPRAAEIARPSQLIELKNVERDDIPTVLDRADEIAGGAPITAKILRRAAKESWSQIHPHSDEPETSQEPIASTSNAEVVPEPIQDSPADAGVRDLVIDRARRQLRKSFKAIRFQFGNLGIGGQAEDELKSLARKAKL